MENYGYYNMFKGLPKKHLELTDTVWSPLCPIAKKAPAALPLQWQHSCCGNKNRKGLRKRTI